MDWFKPSSESISFLSEICLALSVLLYLLGLRIKTRDTYLYAVALIALILFFIICFIVDSGIQKTSVAHYVYVCLYFTRELLFISTLWFAYQFSRNPYKKEMVFVMIAAGSLSLGSIFFDTTHYAADHIVSAFFKLLLQHGLISIYSIILLVRKIKVALKSGSAVNGISVPLHNKTKKQFSFFTSLKDTADKEVKAYRGFALYNFMILVISVLFDLYNNKMISPLFWQYSFHTLLLLSITFSAFTYLNYSRDPISFNAKLVWIVLFVILMVLGLLPYGLFGAVDADSAISYPEQSLKIFLMLVPAVTILVVILLPLVFRYNILRPLDEVIRGVKQVNTGDLNTSVKEDVNDEIGTLSKNFNQMTNSLRAYSNKMEELVAERTSQLQDSINHLKATQSQLIQSEKMASLGELTAGIAHEIQNPLNFVNNFSEVNTELIEELQEERHKEQGTRDEKLESEILNDIKENEKKINHHGKRADAIVKGMLQHSRSSTGVKEPTNINALADEYLRLAYHGSKAKDNSFNAAIKTNYDESIGNVNIIPQDIGRVLLNLYNNAFYAVAEKQKQLAKDLSGFENLTGLGSYEPTVAVSTKKLGNGICISVSDNGNGIPQKAIDKIFQPFFTTKPTGQGTGLGLSLSYDIIKSHGGEIKVNTSEGEFTEFVIELQISA